MPRNAVQLTCEQCKQRKTKCDKVQRARLPRGKTGKGRSKNAALESKVARLESLVGRLETQFRGDGIVNDANGMSDLAANPKPVDFGGKIENTIARDFWLAISSEVHGLRETLEEPDEDEAAKSTQPTISDPQSCSHWTSNDLLFNQSRSTSHVDAFLHPSPATRSILLQTYRERVDCLFKVIHWPTVCSNLESLWAGALAEPMATVTAVLESAIYFLAICSLAQDDCERLQLGDRFALMDSFRKITEMLLAKAGLLTTTSLTVLQAFVLYLAGIRSSGDAASTWTLLALAVRIADACGLPKSSNATSALDREIGRRVWFSIALLDSQVSFGRGSEPLLTYEHVKTLPTNINDSEMSLQFVPTISTSGSTDMSFPCLAAHSIMCQRKLSNPKFSSWRERLVAVEAFELFANRTCGPYEFSDKPIEKFTAYSARYMVAAMQLSLRRPPYRNSAPVPATDTYDVLDGACSIAQHELSKQKSAEFACFLWYSWPKWYALAIVLVELCSLRHGPKFDRAYCVAQESYALYARSAADASSGILWKPIAKLMRQVEKLKRMSSFNEKSNVIDNMQPSQSNALPKKSFPNGPVSIDVTIPRSTPREFFDAAPILNDENLNVPDGLFWDEWDVFLDEMPSWKDF
ncbi:hypothetical protein OHC33_005885 [Knufia fluminis]|uniref:Xylanolytic transcriptional activator regulatory domain-containing protein n=1 Tax=Knufia fluminis TaxID=191047 RepID=A0AAN8IML5_9EURO|nr:hypothetical protein OHC33_005885 [Knufia fluminis]